MYSVTKRVEMIKQPRSGYLKTGLFVKEEYDDGIILNKNENISPIITGITVDYLTRYMSGFTPEDSFSISLSGAKMLDVYMQSGNKEEEIANECINRLDGLSDESIISACKLAGYDVCVRASCDDYKRGNLLPDEYTILNIRNMVQRSLDYFEIEGGLKEINVTFEGGYTGLISSGDADYLTSNGLWDMKVSKHDLSAEYTLQLLVYYLMGLKSQKSTFENINKLGFFNPRKNMCYWTDVSFIPQSVISLVSREVIGYEEY